MGFVAAVIAIFIALNVRDLTSWKYAAVGDEYGGFEWARGIARGMPFNPFWQKGAGDLQSVLTSAGQAVFLKLFGEDIFAWKLHLVVFAAAAFVPLYLLMRELFSRRVALFSLPIWPARTISLVTLITLTTLTLSSPKRCPCGY